MDIKLFLETLMSLLANATGMAGPILLQIQEINTEFQQYLFLLLGLPAGLIIVTCANRYSVQIRTFCSQGLNAIIAVLSIEKFANQLAFSLAIFIVVDNAYVFSIIFGFTRIFLIFFVAFTLCMFILTAYRKAKADGYIFPEKIEKYIKHFVIFLFASQAVPLFYDFIIHIYRLAYHIDNFNFVPFFTWLIGLLLQPFLVWINEKAQETLFEWKNKRK